jgi:hypothetical protein
VLLYATSGVDLLSSDFVAALAFQELSSVMRNVGATRIVWHRLMRAIGRETATEHPFGSRRAMKTVLHRAVADSIAKLMGISTVIAVESVETLLSHFGGDTLTCTVARCRAQEKDLQLLGLYGVVLGARLLVLVGERIMLVYMIEYYQKQRPGAAKIHVRQLTLRPTDPLPAMEHASFESERASELGSHSQPPTVGPEVLPVPIASYRSTLSVRPATNFAPGGEPSNAVARNGSVENVRLSRTGSRSRALRASMSSSSTGLSIGVKRFKYEVRKLLGSDNAQTTNVLMVAVFALVMSQASITRNRF